MTFDPDAAAPADGGLFGLPHPVEEAAVRVIPVPWEGTVSFGRGTAGGPSAVLEASHQVDLFHTEYGDAVWQAGIALEPVDPRIAEWGRKVAANPLPANVNPISSQLDSLVYDRAKSVLEAGRIPGVLGGEHSVALGGIVAAAEVHEGLGILHIDAHADLRVAYEGFKRSHASVMFNALELAPRLSCLVQVGLRDVGRAEVRLAEQDDRIRWHTDAAIGERTARGTPWSDIVYDLLDALPPKVWVSFDIDGLDPSLCPRTGTPVPGGLTWREVIFLLRTLGASDRQVVGFDLCEIAGEPWDANVGARVLYELAGASISTASRDSSTVPR